MSIDRLYYQVVNLKIWNELTQFILFVGESK